MNKLLAVLLIAFLSIQSSVVLASEDDGSVDSTTAVSTTSESDDTDEEEQEDESEDDSSGEDTTNTEDSHETDTTDTTTGTTDSTDVEESDADEVKDSSNQRRRQHRNQNRNQNGKLKAVPAQKYKKAKKELKRTVKHNRDAMKQNRKDFRTENRDELKSTLRAMSADKKQALKDLAESHKSEVQSLKDEYKGKLQDEEARKEYLEKLKEIRLEHYNGVQENLGDNAEAKALFDKRVDVFRENQEIRTESYKARVEFRAKKERTILKHKSRFVKRLKNSLDKIPEDRIEKVLGKIDTVIEKYESNTRISEKRRDNILSQVIAIKEILEEKLEQNDLESDDFDIEALLED